ncbi:Uncharacterised protein [BD1-7 clade bacterium]|uniref:Rad50/SbcC-type AAA domain-containing protein n=1 Tax=BD1-7 clade bacterium TaxID=2029982 RepID=A0A5S9MRY7_9GAMM|nr:Uncharacterised protein [BD1-7 clade bacterium]CAA0084598.1 Uncharacterised protein [BD1-7 clade bacterium]
MKVKKAAFGAIDKAFIESRFQDRVNIIFSNDNNKGKTLLFQGILYSLGNEPIFPAGFPFNDYYFYSKIEIGGNDVEFIRKGRSIIVRDDGGIRAFDSVSEFKYALKTYIPNMPEIYKKDRQKLVDPCLFYELFFVGQDLRDPSSTFSKYYNKSDFMNVLYALAGIGRNVLTSEEIKSLKDRIKNKRNKRAQLAKDINRLNIDPEVRRTVLQSSNNEEVRRKESDIKKARLRVSEVDRALSRELNRKFKLEALLTELNSLNRKIEVGSVKCGDCGSERIVYTNGNFDFELTNSYVKSSMLSSIKEDIKLKEEIIEELRNELRTEKLSLEREVSTAPAKVRDIMLFRDQLNDGSKLDDELVSIDSKIEEISAQLLVQEGDIGENRQAQKEFVATITTLMNKYGNKVDQSKSEEYKGVFAVQGQTYSGSEQQLYYFCKLMAFSSYFNHKFPLIIDAFREGEISSGKESQMLDVFSSIDNQVILSATLKEEEYSAEKYLPSKNINVIDYSGHVDNQILSPEFSSDFRNILKSFGIVVP